MPRKREAIKVDARVEIVKPKTQRKAVAAGKKVVNNNLVVHCHCPTGSGSVSALPPLPQLPPLTLETDEAMLARMPKDWVTPPETVGDQDVIKYAPQFIGLAALKVAADPSVSVKALAKTTYSGKYQGLAVVETAVHLCARSIRQGQGRDTSDLDAHLTKQALMSIDSFDDELTKVAGGTHRCLLVLRDCGLKALKNRIKALGEVLPLTKNTPYMMGPIVLMHKALTASRRSPG